MFKVNDEVVRVEDGGRSKDYGKVVEVSGERARVYWHTYTWNGKVSANKTSKRTWVRFSALQLHQASKIEA